MCQPLGNNGSGKRENKHPQNLLVCKGSAGRPVERLERAAENPGHDCWCGYFGLFWRSKAHTSLCTNRCEMKGQWIGTYAGATGGMIIVNVDESELNYQGVAYLLPSDKTFPASAASFRTQDKEAHFQFRTDALQPIDPTSGLIVPWESVKTRYMKDMEFSKYADVTGSWDEHSLSLSWVSDLGAAGHCVLPRSRADEPSELVAVEKDWGGYKEYVSGLKAGGFLFRGQKNQRRLRTSFHRTGRADLYRFLQEDIPMLHRHLTARTKHIFNLTIGDENGAFLSLAQHHGYPTPLLDWTYSPYVAAFFAYRGIPNQKADKAQPGDKVRIHVFNQARWKADWATMNLVALPGPHLSIYEFLAIENERMIPQQAASTVTNVDDIESYIKSKESETKRYLSAIDLPVGDRKRAVHDLSYMGITAGSLFPGLDGACEELRERNFGL